MKKANRKEIIKMFHFKLSKYWEPHTHTHTCAISFGGLWPRPTWATWAQNSWAKTEARRIFISRNHIKWPTSTSSSSASLAASSCSQQIFCTRWACATWVWALRSIMTEVLTDRLADWRTDCMRAHRATHKCWVWSMRPAIINTIAWPSDWHTEAKA